MPASDTELVRAAADGDTRAFHALVDRHSPSMMRLGVWLSGNREDAEDALQEAFVAAYRGIRSFDGRASFKTWLTRILIRQAVRLRQRSRKRAALSLAGVMDGRQSDVQEPAIDSPAEQVAQRIDLAAGIQSLPEDQRQVVLLREVHGMAYEEIAQALDIPRGTVESRLHRARLALRRRLKGYAPQEQP